MRWWALVPFGLVGAGLVLVALAVFQGGAQLAIVVFVPVIFGRSLEFVVGVLLLVAGLFAVPLAFETREDVDPPTPPGSTSTKSGGVQGLVLVGPVPIFFGSWRDVPTRTRVIAAVVGTAVLAVAILVLVLFRV